MVLSAVDAKLRIEMWALTINALAAADEVIIAENPQLLAMMGLHDFLKSVRKIKNRINPKLEVAGITGYHLWADGENTIPGNGIGYACGWIWDGIL